MKNSKIKEALQKTRDYIQPFSCITLGHKTTSFEFLKRSVSLLLTYILPVTLFGGLMLTNLQISFSPYVYLLILLFIWIMTCLGMTHEKFFEFIYKYQ